MKPEPAPYPSKQIRRLLWQLSIGLFLMLAASYGLIVYQNLQAERNLLSAQFEQIRTNLSNQLGQGKPVSLDSIEPLIFVDNPYQIILYTADQPLVLKRFNYSDGTEANFGLPIWSGQANSLQFDKGFLIAWSEMPGQQQLYVQIAMGGSSYLPVARYEPLLSTLIIPLIIALALLWLTFRVVTSYKREWSRLFHYVDEIDSSRDYRPLRQSNFSEFMRLEHIANRVSFHTHTNKKQLELIRRTKTLLIDEQPLPICVVDGNAYVIESSAAFSRSLNSGGANINLKLDELIELESGSKPLPELLQEHKPLSLRVKNRANQQPYLLLTAPAFGSRRDALQVVSLCPIGGLVSQIDLLTQNVRKMSAQLERDQQRMASLSHELRTPLTGMIATLDLLERTELNDEQLEYVRLFNSSANTLLGMLNDLLDFSKIEAGKLKLSLQEVDVLELVQSCCDLMAGVAERAQVHLFLEVAPGVPSKVQADAPRIKQVLLNLMGNAAKFTRTGEVRLLLESVTIDHPELLQRHITKNHELSWVRFSVIDTGSGISEEGLSRLFSAYEQLGGADQAPRSGTGLGLVISEQLTRLMGGFITAESEIGQGSVFRIYLPLSPLNNHTIYQFKELPPITLALLSSNELLCAWLSRSLGYLGLSIDCYQSADQLPDELSALLIDEKRLGPELLTQLSQQLIRGSALIRLGRNPSVGAQSFAMLSQRFATGGVSKPLFINQLIAEIFRVSAQSPAGVTSFVGPYQRHQNTAWLNYSGSAAQTAKDTEQPIDDMDPAGSASPSYPSQSSTSEDLTQTTTEPSSSKSQNTNSDSDLGSSDTKEADVSHQPLVMLAEDNPTNQVITLAMLKKIGVRTVLAANGEEVLELMQIHDPEMILMDCRMPKLDGISATVQLRKSGYTLPIIALTANDSAEDRQNCFDAGMQDFLAKPLRMKQLARIIKKHQQLPTSEVQTAPANDQTDEAKDKTQAP